MRRALYAVTLLCAVSSPAFAQINIAEYSGYIRVEDRYQWEDKSEQTIANGGFLREHLVQSENRTVLFTVKSGVVTSALDLDKSEASYSHSYYVGACLNGNVSAITQMGRTRSDTRASHSGAGQCEGNASEGHVEMSCWTDALYTETTTNELWGSQQSSCPDKPNGVTQDVTSSKVERDGYRAGFQMDLPTEVLPAVLSGSETSELANGGRRVTTWFMARAGQYELILEPEANYPNWRPKAGASEQERGNALLVKATLQRKDGKPLDIEAKEISFRLAQRSHEPGTLMNFPSAAKRTNPALPDLMFEADLNAPLELQVRGDHGNEAVTAAGSYAEAYAYVSAFDWGAYGTVTAEAVLASGERVAGKLKDSAEQELLIPKRASVDDPIAAAWRAAGANRGGNGLSDEDSQPAGDGHNGDGFSLYEEYRGFQVNGARVEGNPAKKELFVRNKAGGYAIKGIALFAQRAGLRVHSELTAEEINSLRELNFNSSGRFQRVRQHGVVVDVVTEGRSFAIAAGGPGTPGQIEAVEMPLDLYVLKFPAGYADATLAHELGHAVNVYHHGETDPGDKRFRVVNGEVFESGAEDLSLTFEDKVKVTLFREDGTPLALASIDVNRVATVGVRQGQHSGDEACAMRYDVARFHVRDDPSQRFLNSAKEVVGSTFCGSGAGTGVNLQSRLPAPRYGDAATGRGGCARQICVNDGHPHPAR